MLDPYRQLGQRVRWLRRQQGLTQAQLAEKAGVSDNFVGLIERGLGHPTLETLRRMADALDVALGDLFLEGKGEPLSTAEVLKELERLLGKRGPEDAELVLTIAKAIFARFPGRPAP